MTNNGFTLVELLVAVTIISIVGVASISGFSRLGELQDSKTLQDQFLNTLSELDASVRNHEISSYEAVLQSGALGYSIEKDFYGRSDLMKLESYDYSVVTGTLSTNSTSTGTWQIALWGDGRYQGSMISSASGSTLNFSFSGSTRYDAYDILGMIDSEQLNSFSFQYYGDAWSDSTPESQIRLTSISGSLTSYPALKIRNMLGKKEIHGSGTSLDPLESVVLGFEKNGRETNITIKK